MRKILYVYDGKMSWNGIDAVVRRQLAALTNAGYEVDLVARRGAEMPGVTDHPQHYTPANLISWLPRKYYYPAQKRWFSSRGSSLLKKNDYAAVVTWVQRGLNAFRTAAHKGVPCFLNCDTVHYLTARPPGQRPIWPEYRLRELQEEYDLSARILTPSDYSRDTFVEAGVDSKKVAVIGRGVDTERFYPAPASTEARPFRLVFCGRVDHRKGIQQTVDAWKLAALPNAELWVLGAIAPELKEFAEANASETIRFFGFQKETPELLRQCDAQILPSQVEGMAKSLLEGAATGLATLTTHEAGFPLRDGVNGFAIQRADVEGIARRIRQLHEDRELCRKLGTQGCEDVAQNYSWDCFAKRFWDVMNETLGRASD